jgi:hypothetical protein
MSNLSAPPALHGAWSSFCYLGVPIVCGVKKKTSVIDGMLAGSAFNLSYISYKNWERYYAELWTTAQQAAFGLQKLQVSGNHIVHDDHFALLFMSCSAVALSIEYSLQALAKETKFEELAQWSSLVGLVSGGMEFMTLQYLCKVEDGQPIDAVHDAVMANVGITIALMYISGGIMVFKTKLWKVFIMDVCIVPFGGAVVGIAQMYQFLQIHEISSVPLFSGFLASIFHAYTAWSLCFAMLWPHGNETRKPSSAIGARLLVSLVPLLVVPSILCRGMPPSTYHALPHCLCAAYTSLRYDIFPTAGAYPGEEDASR